MSAARKFGGWWLCVILIAGTAGSGGVIADEAGDREEPSSGENSVRDELVASYFERIRDLKFDYGRVGSVLEALAFLELQQVYPEPEYEILSGLQYQNYDNHTAGELDLVVWEKKSRRAIKVYEVKLSLNLSRAHKLALAQLERFKTHLKEKNISGFIYNRNRGRFFRVSQFKEIESFEIVGSQGALEEGYDREIDLSREEADSLQRLLIGHKMKR